MWLAIIQGECKHKSFEVDLFCSSSLHHAAEPRESSSYSNVNCTVIQYYITFELELLYLSSLSYYAVDFAPTDWTELQKI